MAATLILRVDGGSRGNPGPAAYGVAVEDEQGQPLASLRAALGHQTNNYAEYCGLLAGLRHAREQGAQRVRVFADSELLVRQMQGHYQVKSPNLQPLHAEAKRLAASFADFAIAHVRREQNREADRLANLAMDEAAKPNRER